MRHRALKLLLAATVALSGRTVAAGERPLAPDWEVKSLSGQPVRLSDYKGKVVVLNFWATWCGPCHQEIPDLIKLQKDYGQAGVVVIGMAMDTGSVEPVAASARTLGINYPVVLADGATVVRYGGIEFVPTTYIIDRTGHIAAVHTARVDGRTLEAEIKPLL